MQPSRVGLLMLGLLCGSTSLPSLTNQGTLRVDIAKKHGTFELPLADLLPITVEVVAGPGQKVQAPKTIIVSPGWQVRKQTPLERHEIGDRSRWQQAFWLEALAPGELPLQLEPWQLWQGDKESDDVAWPALTVKVTTSLAKVDVNEARDITDIEPVPVSSETTGPLWPWLVAGGCLLFGVGWWFGRRWRRPSAKPASSPGDRALMQVDRLLARGLHQDGRQHQFLALLTLIIRHYLEKTLDQPARRRTSKELLAMLEEKAAFDSDRMAALAAFFNQCDQARFAPEPISAQECEALAHEARSLATG